MLVSIASNQAALNQLATDLNTNFLNALTSRFTLSSWQISRVNFLLPMAKNDIANIFTRCAANYATNHDNPVDPIVSGITDIPGLPTAAIATTGEGSVTVDSTGLVTVDAKVTVSC